jgi:hypothetical protein
VWRAGRTRWTAAPGSPGHGGQPTYSAEPFIVAVFSSERFSSVPAPL